MTEETQPAPPHAGLVAFAASLTGKAGMIVILMLLLLIPLSAISGPIEERQERQNDVQTEFRHLLWNEAIVVTAATDLRGQPAGATAEVNGQTAPLLLNAITSSCGGTVAASAQLVGTPAVGATIPFRSNLTLRGTQSLNVLPYGLQLDVHMASPWQTPGFTGSTLPETHDTDHAGFQADWQIAGDAVSGGWSSGPTPSPLCAQQRPTEAVFGVDLLEPVPTYLMVNRPSKYGALFLVLSFVTYFLFETVAHIRIHIVQYGLLGLSVSLFALLLIALAELLGFLAGYVLSTVAVMGQASLYTLSVVGSARLASIFGGILGLLFGFLYVVLSLEAFSLLAGTLALFVVLPAIMSVTCRLDWNRPGAVNVR